MYYERFMKTPINLKVHGFVRFVNEKPVCYTGKNIKDGVGRDGKGRNIVITLILAFVFLHEKFTVKSAVGAALITAGTLVMVL